MNLLWVYGLGSLALAVFVGVGPTVGWATAAVIATVLAAAVGARVAP